ncbi:MAG TPA: hypothetical protein ENH49_02780 [Candidatus Marinimicrobia bacterium]|nr:hypothetical protein [Candidatus Neomarinimicrobiota bacterium]
MITILCHDKKGKEVSNGDKIRWFQITPEWQDEYGDNIPRPGGHYRHQVDTDIGWEEMIYEPQEEAEGGFISLPPGIYYDHDMLCELFGLPNNIPDDEFQECVLDLISNEIGDKLSLADTLNVISGFEVVT